MTVSCQKKLNYLPFKKINGRKKKKTGRNEKKTPKPSCSLFRGRETCRHIAHIHRGAVTVHVNTIITRRGNFCRASATSLYKSKDITQEALDNGQSSRELDTTGAPLALV